MSPRSQFRLTVAVPMFNEQRTIARCLEDLLAVEMPFDWEVVVVDDGSTDGGYAEVQPFTDERLRVLSHAENQGKGAALLTAAAHARGTHIVPFDADLEYDPRDLPRLAKPIVEGRAVAAFGNRRHGECSAFASYRYALGNRVMTHMANVLYDAAIGDLHTCLKMVPLPLFRALNLRERGFGLDTELACGVLRSGIRPASVPISYFARTHGEGKKIGWRDAVHCGRLMVTGRRGETVPQHQMPRARRWSTADEMYGAVREPFARLPDPAR